MKFTLLKSPAVKVVCIVLLVLLLLPEVLRFALIKAVPAMGFGEITIEDVDLNLFAGSAAIRGVLLTREDQQKLTVGELGVNLNWSQALFGIVDVESLYLAGASLEVLEKADGSWEVVIPLEAPAATQTDTNASVTATESVALPRIAAQKISLSDVSIKLASHFASGTLLVDSFEIDRASTWLQQAISLQMTASWNGAPIALQLLAKPWNEEPTLTGQLSLQRFELGDLAALIGQPLSGVANIDLEMAALQDAGGKTTVSVNGQIALDALSATYRQLALSNREFLWQGDVELILVEEGPSYTVRGDVLSSGLSVVDQQQQLELLAWQQFKVDSFSIDELLNVNIEQWSTAEVEAIKSTGSDAGRLYVGSTNVQNITLQAATQLSIDDILIGDGQYQVLITPEGELQLQNVLMTVLARLTAAESQTQAQTLADPEPAAEAEKEFTLIVNRLQFAEGTKVRLVDQRFRVPVEQILNIKTLSVQNINQLQPELATTVALKGSLGEFSSISLAGEIKPFAENLWLDIKGELDAIPLPALSPYSETVLGYHLKRGQYDHQFELTIDQGEILLENKLLLRQLQVASVDASQPQPLARQLNIPLGVALDMLRDGDDNIQLVVPIKGRMDDPDIELGEVLNSALARALKSGASSYLTLALQPYGAVLMAAEFARDQLSAVRLQPMVYEAGASALTSEQQDYALKVLSVLQQRPKLSLTLCGYANDADKLALEGEGSPVDEAELIAMAERRASEIKRLLINQGVEGRRIFLCQPGYAADAKPVVTMSM